jgi:hypothetical protein
VISISDKVATKLATKGLIVVAVILLGLALTITAQSNTPPPFSVISITATPTPTSPGVSKVSITLLYTGGTYLYGTNFQLIPCPGTTIPINVISTDPVYVGWITPNQQITITYLINTTVPLNCQSTLEITWNAQYQQSPRAQEITYIQVAGSGSTSMNLPLTIYGEPIITLTTNATYVISNLANPLKLIIKNNGSGPLYNAQISVSVQGATIIPSMSSISIGTLNPGSEYVDVIYITPTGSGPISLTVTYSGIDQGGNVVSNSYMESLSVVPASPSQVIVYPVNSSLNVGFGKLILGVRNVNPVPIYNVTLVIQSTNGLALVRNATYNIPEVGPGNTYYLEIPIVVPITSNSAQLTYTLTYQYVNGYPESLGGSLTMGILNIPSILITGYTAAPSIVTVGSTTTVSITFTNTGATPAYNLNVTAIPGPGLTIISQPSTYLGILNPQQLSAAAFSFMATKPINTTVTFLITYTDQFGQMHSVYYTVPLSISRNTTLPSVTPHSAGYHYNSYHSAVFLFIALLVIAIVVVIIIVILTTRRSKVKE